MLSINLEQFKKENEIIGLKIDHGYYSTINFFHEDLKHNDNKTPNIKKNFKQWRKQLSSNDDDLAINERHCTAIYAQIELTHKDFHHTVLVYGQTPASSIRYLKKKSYTKTK